MPDNERFEPVIIGFTCNWCSYRAADLAGTAIAIADDDDNQIFILDIVKPRERYVRVVVDKDTTNACAESAIYVGYGPRVMPVALTLTDEVTYEKHVSPAEGTA